MASNDQSSNTTQGVSPSNIAQPSPSAQSISHTNIKWKDVCEENAKLVAEKLFASLFVDHSISIPPDLTLSIIIQQFYQILREKLKELVQNKISDWEIRYPSLLLTASRSLCIKNEDDSIKVSSSSDLEFSTNLSTTDQSYLVPGNTNNISATNIEGKDDFYKNILYFHQNFY